MSDSDMRAIFERVRREEMERLSNDKNFIDTIIHRTRMEQLAEKIKNGDHPSYRKAKKQLKEQIAKRAENREKTFDKPWPDTKYLGNRVAYGFQGDLSERYNLHCDLPEENYSRDWDDGWEYASAVPMPEDQYN